MCSDQKRLTRWTPQEYIQNQCKDTSACNVTAGDANLTTQAMQITWWGVHRLIAWSWKNFTFQATSHDIVARQPISVEFLPTSMTSRRHKRCWNLLNRLWIRHSGQLLLCVNTVELQQHNFIHHRIKLWTWTRCHKVFQHSCDFHNWCCAKRMIKSAVDDDRKWQALLPPDATS